jgi:hypothetical protein
MLTEDYIMRMINQAMAAFLQALGLKKAGKYSEAQQSFNQSIEVLLGLRADLVDQLDDSQVLTMLTFLDRLDTDRLLLLADIYHEQGEVLALLQHHPESQFAAQRSLRFYLEVALATDSVPPLELIQKIETQRQKITPTELGLETRLAMLDYYERLLEAGTALPVEAGLPRQELQALISLLDTPDLH